MREYSQAIMVWKASSWPSDDSWAAGKEAGVWFDCFCWCSAIFLFSINVPSRDCMIGFVKDLRHYQRHVQHNIKHGACRSRRLSKESTLIMSRKAGQWHHCATMTECTMARLLVSTRTVMWHVCHCKVITNDIWVRWAVRVVPQEGLCDMR